ncbi:MAG TPA: methylated-DNA--[protein]-cysteine S-methyltransferase [Acidobacteriota bacterium]|nr:methylated-DNA--[protein]-cysteine S-methyltransferase [Acidobacteriota bacterium]
MMQCEVVLEVLDGFRTGELRGHDLRETTDHLSSCADCARALAEIEVLAARARELRAPAPKEMLGQILGSIGGDRYADVETELGRMWVGFSSKGITLICPTSTLPMDFEQRYQKQVGRKPLRSSIPESYAHALQQAAAGRPAAKAPIDLSRLSPFEREVLLHLRRIPRGEVRTYGWLAQEAGRPRAVRAVGNTMARNPVPLLLPCHRIVPAAGGIGQYAFGSALKRELLKREDTPIAEIERLACEGVRYIGCLSTRIYCFPTCHDARRMRPENRVPFRSVEEAGEAGYRPCLHCRPALSPRRA